jgi:hypothetical protein
LHAYAWSHQIDGNLHKSLQQMPQMMHVYHHVYPRTVSRAGTPCQTLLMYQVPEQAANLMNLMNLENLGAWWPTQRENGRCTNSVWPCYQSLQVAAGLSGTGIKSGTHQILPYLRSPQGTAQWLCRRMAWPLRDALLGQTALFTRNNSVGSLPCRVLCILCCCSRALACPIVLLDQGVV